MQLLNNLTPHIFSWDWPLKITDCSYKQYQPWHLSIILIFGNEYMILLNFSCLLRKCKTAFFASLGTDKWCMYVASPTVTRKLKYVETDMTTCSTAVTHGCPSGYFFHKYSLKGQCYDYHVTEICWDRYDHM